MEPKKSSSQHQFHAMEPKGKKSSPRGTAAAAAEAESPLSSLFNPPAQGAAANGKDQDLYRILYKGQSGGGHAGMADGKTQWTPSKSRTTHNGKHSQTYDSVDTSCFGSSVHYGGRDYYGNPATMETTESSNEYKVDKKDPATDSHGDWWQGSFYY